MNEENTARAGGEGRATAHAAGYAAGEAFMRAALDAERACVDRLLAALAEVRDAEAAAHAGAAVQGAARAAADGVVDEHEATALREGPVRQALAAVQRLDAGLAVKQRRLRAVGR